MWRWLHHFVLSITKQAKCLNSQLASWKSETHASKREWCLSWPQLWGRKLKDHPKVFSTLNVSRRTIRHAVESTKKVSFRIYICLFFVCLLLLCSTSLMLRRRVHAPNPSKWQASQHLQSMVWRPEWWMLSCDTLQDEQDKEGLRSSENANDFRRMQTTS